MDPDHLVSHLPAGAPALGRPLQTIGEPPKIAASSVDPLASGVDLVGEADRDSGSGRVRLLLSTWNQLGIAYHRPVLVTALVNSQEGAARDMERFLRVLVAAREHSRNRVTWLHGNSAADPVCSQACSQASPPILGLPHP